MSQIPPSNDPLAAGGPPDAPRRATGRRAASVTLRQGEVRAQSMGDLLDPANKSLADALRIAFRILQGLIFAMVVVFIFSATQQIQTSELGIRTTLGRIEPGTLSPGLHFSWPEPFGAILRVQRTDQTIELTKPFFPNLAAAEEALLGDKGVGGLADGGTDTLDPDNDGALLTADGSLVHTRWFISYRRTNDDRSLRTLSVDPDAPEIDRDRVERQIVSSVARSAIVHAAATMTIDEVLYDQKDPNRKGAFLPINEVAKTLAQNRLEAMNSGIELQQFAKRLPMAPRRVMTSFSSVQTAQAKAKQAREAAGSEARNRLLKAAGEGAELVLAQIDRYEGELATGKTAESAATLERIHQILRSKPVEIDGKTVAGTVSGDVSVSLVQADQYRTGVVTRARADSDSFQAKLAAYRANPQVYLIGEWSDAVSSFLNRPTVQAMFLPPGLERLVVQINKDPYLSKEIEKGINEREAEANKNRIIQNRQRELGNQKFNGTSMEGN